MSETYSKLVKYLDKYKIGIFPYQRDMLSQLSQGGFNWRGRNQHFKRKIKLVSAITSAILGRKVLFISSKDSLIDEVESILKEYHVDIKYEIVNKCEIKIGDGSICFDVRC